MFSFEPVVELLKERMSALIPSQSPLDWVGNDLYLTTAQTSNGVLNQATPAIVPPILSSSIDQIPKDSLGHIVRTGLLFATLAGCMRYIRASRDAKLKSEAEEESPSGHSFEKSIRRIFKNQNAKTLTTLKEVIDEMPANGPRLVVLFASEESALTALKLSVKMMQVVCFNKSGESKSTDEIEQEHVVSGQWYAELTVSQYFLRELPQTLAQKTGVIINNFQDMHPNTAADLVLNNELNCLTSGVLLTIINCGDSAKIPSEETALSSWLHENLAPHLKLEAAAHRQIKAVSCVVAKEPLSTLLII